MFQGSLYIFRPKKSETYIPTTQIYRVLFGELGSKDRPLTPSTKSAKHGNVHAKPKWQCRHEKGVKMDTNQNTNQVSDQKVAVQDNLGFVIPDFSDLVSVQTKVVNKIELNREQVGFTLGCILAAAKARGVVVTPDETGSYGEMGWLSSHPNSLGIRAKLGRSNNFRSMFKGSGLDINADDLEYYSVAELGFMILTVAGQIILLDSPSNKDMNLLYLGTADAKALITDLVQYLGVRTKMGSVPGNFDWKRVRV